MHLFSALYTSLSSVLTADFRVLRNKFSVICLFWSFRRAGFDYSDFPILNTQFAAYFHILNTHFATDFHILNAQFSAIFVCVLRYFRAVLFCRIFVCFRHFAICLRFGQETAGYRLFGVNIEALFIFSRKTQFCSVCRTHANV